ncbi:ABC transporter substrate-binding protein [Rhodovastum atsumiense]|uniref:ABC transporter substrate-binding protein n=1 Tax=Rhodovastum atsumiense TaxID=504468 RepID=A0A5M6ILZ2_9PROT|nr:ABC transporter substrate-binding protein [Rhodovastum atsumiense]KAA5608568.1 ABC transporter substrate-binding protein [Rhodovastum atsumiense]CAH2598792.1 ABC transporter substrate-binding protein [Rhodovastum atsumiense]
MSAAAGRVQKETEGKMKLWKIAAPLALVVALLAAPAARAAGPAKPDVIRYANIPWFDPVYVADEKGWFAEEGLKIEWVGEISASQLVPAVAARSIDISNRMTPLILTARAGGAKLRIIAAGAQTTPELPHMKYLVSPQSPIRSIEDLRGKKVGINSFGACSEYVLKEYLRRNGLDKTINFVVVPDANQEQALAQGLIDVGVLHSPYYEKVVKTGAAREIFTDYAVDDGVPGMLPYFTHEDIIRTRPDVLRRFVKVLVRASDWTNKNHEEAGQIFARRRGLDLRYAGSWSYYEHGLVPNDKPVQWWIDYLVGEGQLPAGKEKARNVYTNEFNPYYKS